MYHIAIVEDDENDRNQIKSYIEKFAASGNQAFKISEFTNAVTFLTGYKPIYDIIMIDIQMPHMNGMDAAVKLREKDAFVPLVFVTNMSGYAIKGYSVNAVDFIVKPLRYDNFSVMMSKLLRIVNGRIQTVLISTSEGKIKMPVDSIAYIEIVGHQLSFFTDEGTYVAWGTLKEWESILPNERFVKCNNYCIVNLKHIDKYTDGNVFINGNIIPASRSKKKEVSDKLLAYYSKYI